MNLDIKNPNAEEALAHLPPEQLVESILTKGKRIIEIMADIKRVLAGGRKMSKRPGSEVVLVDRIEPCILLVRGQRVMLDADLAELYGTSTKALNQAVKRNLDRFPADFMFQLTAEEAATMRSQTVTKSAPPRAARCN